MRVKRALTVNDIRAYKPNILEFEGVWQEAIGNPELTGSWLIWGNSTNGKTRFALQLTRYLTNFKRVVYNSFEEGLSESMKKAVINVGIERNFLLLDKEPISELRNRLSRRKSPDVIIIDSLQYTGINYTEYKRLRDEFRNKLFIFVSHADGNEPRGNVAKSVRYDANVKIWVQGYRAFPQSRYGGGTPYVVWAKGAAEYWGIDN